MSVSSSRQTRWRSPLLWAVIALFVFLNFSGFALFFARPWISNSQALGNLHIIAGIITLLPYGVYQMAHVRRVQGFRGLAHYKLGLCTMASFLLASLSGAWMIDPGVSQFVKLLHLMSSFAFLVFLTAHLIAVARLLALRNSGA